MTSLPSAPNTEQGDRRRFDVAVRNMVLAHELAIANLKKAAASAVSSSSIPASVAKAIRDLQERVTALEQGGGSSAVPITLIAGEEFNTGQVAAVDASGAVLGDYSENDHGEQIIGLFLNAGGIGVDALIAVDGQAVDSDAWSWTRGQPLYVGSSGALSASPGTGLFIKQIAIALSANRVAVCLGDAYVTERKTSQTRIIASRSDGIISPTLTVGITNVVPSIGMLVPEDMTMLVGTGGLRLDGPLILDGRMHGL